MVAAASWYGFGLLAPVNPAGRPVRVEIPAGANAGEIADRLKRARVIRSAAAFTVAARVSGESKNMKAGEYRLSPALGVFQIIDELVEGSAEAYWVVVPEGKTLAQVGEILAERKLARPSAFRRACKRRPKHFGLDVPVYRRSVEGYLMPDTYKFPRTMGEQAVIRAMLANWNQKVIRPHRALFRASDLPLDKIVIIASMIEREARVPEDRPLISSVIRNRIRKKMKLQIDATVIYALGRHTSVVTNKDLTVASRYNTYRVAGLPPGPICSPGLASILAALQPAKTEYYYYVARGDGSHQFSKTAAEHDAAVSEARRMNGRTAASR